MRPAATRAAVVLALLLIVLAGGLLLLHRGGRLPDLDVEPLPPPGPATGSASGPPGATGDGAGTVLEQLLQQEIPAAEDLTFLGSLDAALELGRREARPVLHVLTRHPTDAGWERFLSMLRGDRLNRAIISTMARAHTWEPTGIEVSPTIAVFSTEVVLLAEARLEETPEGWVAHVPGRPGANGFSTACSPVREGETLIRDLEGRPLVRNRVIEFFTGLPSTDELGRRLWAAHQGEAQLLQVIDHIQTGEIGAATSRLALSDDYYGWLTPDERIRTALTLLHQEPRDPWAVHRITMVLLGADVAVPGRFLPEMRRIWGSEDSAPGRFLEGQVARVVDGDLPRALEHLEIAAALESESPHLQYVLARTALALAREQPDPVLRDRYLERARQAAVLVQLLEPDLPGLWRLQEELREF